MGAFHAYDIRGVYGVDFDSTTAYKVGYFIPRLLDTDKVLVGRDCRVSSLEIRDALVNGLTDAGADVWDLGLCSTPMVYFGTANYGFKASVQITASHNPAEYNGMKVSRENALPVGLDSGLGQIREWIEGGIPTPPAEVRGKVHQMDVIPDYLEFLSAFKQDLSGLNIAFDLSNGMSCLLAKKVFGDSPEYINDTLDGSFPNHDPNPLIPRNVAALKSLVRSTKADIGVIYDGDADRVMFVDNEAEFIAPDLVIALMAEYYVKVRGEKNPRVLQEIRSSKSVAESLQTYGAELYTWKVGRANAAPKLREIDGIWGGELAGHYYFKDFFYSDSGILASMIVLGIVASLKKEGKTIAGFMKGISRYRNSGEINFKLEDKPGAMDAVKAHFTRNEDPQAVMDFDGYRVEFKDWWFNIRPSNTEPYLRFICEAVTDDLLKKKIAETRELLESRFGAVLS
ncbi:MAG: phosphomannomutase/phosphoglucomutase [Bacteroidales bacterium]|nr:phosphomannomutase/phosphoglucomutase [Bacteroidales bacterium]